MKNSRDQHKPPSLYIFAVSSMKPIVRPILRDFLASISCVTMQKVAPWLQESVSFLNSLVVGRQIRARKVVGRAKGYRPY